MAAGSPISRTVPRWALYPAPMLALAGLAVTTGVIHVVAMVEHVGVSWMFGVFFALVGTGQLLVGWRIYQRPNDSRVLTRAAWGNLVVALLWVFSRTSGLPFGPDAGEVSSVGVADTIATLEEFAFAAIAVAVLWRPDPGHRRRAWLSARLVDVGSVLGVRFTMTVLSASLLAAALGGHQH